MHEANDQKINERLIVNKLPDRHRQHRSLVERDKEEGGFVRVGWEETKEGDAVGGARLMIEIGAEFPIGTTDSRFSSLRSWYRQAGPFAAP
jgi:hypothetical protein